MPDESYPDAYNGDYWELYRVENYEDEEEEKIAIGYTQAGVQPIDQDAEEWEINPSTGEITQQFRGHREFGVEFSQFVTIGLPALEDMGITDEEGYFLFHDTWEAAEVHVFDRGPDGPYDDLEPVDRIVLPSFDPMLSEMDLQQGDSGDLNWEANVNGRPYVPTIGEEV
ncbi:hypothetical protein [Natrononativus amylolyticus]|uniref:hypothetical protein n=1 Tax=Natrononativus amylolyticus TaxID=2963434 RepID=UPI0020CEE09E|nr:hypothetical protein [Natrononativus amylolyticus]